MSEFAQDPQLHESVDWDEDLCLNLEWTSAHELTVKDRFELVRERPLRIDEEGPSVYVVGREQFISLYVGFKQCGIRSRTASSSRTPGLSSRDEGLRGCWLNRAIPADAGPNKQT